MATITVHFVESDGKTVRTVQSTTGISAMELAHREKIDIPGLCEGSLACSTCHVIVDSDWYEKLDKPSEDEEDMLDLAFGLTRYSRLSCQIMLTEELDGIRIALPRKK